MEKNIHLKKILYYSTAIFLLFAVYSCHRKTFPSKTETETESGSTAATASSTTAVPAKKVAPISAKEYLKEKAKKGDASPPPPMIVVNDNAARKTADGKYYYELNGYRYWKNNKDGKYYLNGIFNNKSFKKKTKN